MRHNGDTVMQERLAVNVGFFLVSGGSRFPACAHYHLTSKHRFHHCWTFFFLFFLNKRLWVVSATKPQQYYSVSTHYLMWAILLGVENVTECLWADSVSKHPPVHAIGWGLCLFQTYATVIMLPQHLSGPICGCNLPWLILFELFFDLQCLTTQCLR